VLRRIHHKTRHGALMEHLTFNGSPFCSGCSQRPPIFYEYLSWMILTE